MNTIMRPIQSIRWETAKPGIITLLVVVVVMTLFNLYQAQMELPPAIAGYRLFRVFGSSMEPTLSSGAILVVKEVPVESIKPADVITYHCTRSELAMTTHRVKNVEMIEGGCYQYTTRGDGNPVVDPVPIAGCDVVGKVMYVITPPTIAWITPLWKMTIYAWIFASGGFLVMIGRLMEQQKKHYHDQLTQ